MMTYQELAELHRLTKGQRILTAYLSGPSPDPALRDEWEVRLEAGLSHVRQRIAGDSRVEQEAFRSASEHLLRALSGDARPSERGVVVFAAADGVRHAGRTPDRVKTFVDWGEGALVTPYLAAMSRGRPSLVALIDKRSAKLFRVREDGLEAVLALAAHVRVEEPIHMGDSPRPPFHHGVHGATGTDENQRRELAAFERMLNDVLEPLGNLVTPDTWLVVGGMPESVQRLANGLPKTFADRFELVSGLTTESSDSEIQAAADGAVTDLIRRRDGKLVRDLLDRGRAGGKASLGLERTRLALVERAAFELCFSRSLVDDALPRAEPLARLALDGGAHVNVVTGEGGALLDTECEGVAANLRFALPFDALVAAGMPEAASDSGLLGSGLA